MYMYCVVHRISRILSWKYIRLQYDGLVSSWNSLSSLTSSNAMTQVPFDLREVLDCGTTRTQEYRKFKVDDKSEVNKDEDKPEDKDEGCVNRWLFMLLRGVLEEMADTLVPCSVINLCKMVQGFDMPVDNTCYVKIVDTETMFLVLLPPDHDAAIASSGILDASPVIKRHSEESFAASFITCSNQDLKGGMRSSRALKVNVKDSIKKYKVKVTAAHEYNFVLCCYLALYRGIPVALDDVRLSFGNCASYAIEIDISLLRKVVCK